MEFYEVFISFLRILQQSIKLFLKNWKSLAFVAILSQFLMSNCVLLISYIFKSLNSAMNDAVMAPDLAPTTATSVGSSQSTALIMLKYLGPLLVVEIALVFVLVIISNFSSDATILISVASCREKTLSLQDLISILRKACTSIILNKGMTYWIFMALLWTILWLMNNNYISLWIWISIFCSVLSLICGQYLKVYLILAMVVTAVEESYEGKEALQKAVQLIEGQKIQVTLLNILLNLLALVSVAGYWMILGDKWMLRLTELGVFTVNIASMVKMFGLVAYTVLYSEGMKLCGEDIEVLGTMEYTKLSNDIP